MSENLDKLVEQLRHACSVACGDLLVLKKKLENTGDKSDTELFAGLLEDESIGKLLTAIKAAEKHLADTSQEQDLNALVEQLRHAGSVARGDLLAHGMPAGVSTDKVLCAALAAAEKHLTATVVS